MENNIPHRGTLLDVISIAYYVLLMGLVSATSGPSIFKNEDVENKTYFSSKT